ncbi:MAG: hypothetical protein R2744_08175 [Bacteroidales bacterium]
MRTERKIKIAESTWASSWDYSLIIQYGISDRLTADIYIPYRNERWNYYKSFVSAEYNTLQEESWDLLGQGFSDISLSARYQLIVESSNSVTGTLAQLSRQEARIPIISGVTMSTICRPVTE